ncbi:MAG: hypothetical protein OEX11_03075 [Nitrosomonas sp.]|nr:hypothetical protein [Nitrosomonas sp.]
MITNINTEEELLREIELEDEWFESLDVNSLEDVFEDLDDDEIISCEDEDDEDWFH